MGATKVNHISDLPDWFALDKYEGQKSLDAAGWLGQLYIRRFLLKYGTKDVRNLWLSAVKDTPIVDVTKHEKLWAYFGNSTPWRSVRLTTLGQIYLIEGRIEKEKRDYARKHYGEFFNEHLLIDVDFTETIYSYEDWMDEPVDDLTAHKNDMLNVTVNLAVSDKVLAEQFKKLLEERRTHLKSVGGSIDSKQKLDFEGWVKFGVLPYFDLTLWAKSQGQKIPNRVMADAIFLAGEGGEEVVRKTTKKIVEEMLTEAFLEQLTAVAAS